MKGPWSEEANDNGHIYRTHVSVALCWGILVELSSSFTSHNHLNPHFIDEEAEG